MTKHLNLEKQLSDDGIVVAPGIFDALGAVLVEQAGFHSAYLSGASIAYTRFGQPDIGLVSMSEVADVLSAITERSSLPIIVDADTGFGNALNVMRTVRLFENIGAAAIQLEDQTLPKRCGHLAGKTLVPTGEMVGKIKSALDARRSTETLIIARTDSIATEGFASATAPSTIWKPVLMCFLSRPRKHKTRCMPSPSSSTAVFLCWQIWLKAVKRPIKPLQSLKL